MLQWCNKSYQVLLVIGLMVGGCHKSASRSGLSSSSEIDENLSLDAEKGSGEQPSGEELLTKNPKSQAEYIEAMSQLQQKSVLMFASHLKLKRFLGDRVSTSCALKLKIQHLKIQLAGTTASGDAIESLESQKSGRSGDHYMGLYLGERDDALGVKRQSYDIFSQPFVFPEVDHRIQDIQKIKLVQHGSNYFDGQSFTIRSIKLWARDILVFDDTVDLKFGSDKSTQMVSYLTIKQNRAYQAMVQKTDCGSI